MSIFITNSAVETKRLGRRLAKEILEAGPQKQAVVIGLIGDLGGGKTTFLQGFARGLGIREKILSPTFVIMKKFQIPSSKLQASSSKFQAFYHFDCYRIESAEEVLVLGLKEILNRPENIIAIEWVDRVEKILPLKNTILTFGFIDEEKRRIILPG